MSPRDVAASVGVILAFAALVTAHLAIAAALFMRPRRWRGVAALLLPPLAPYYALQEKMRARGIAWLAALAAYSVLLAVASR
jgi:hypothetical protein